MIQAVSVLLCPIDLYQSVSTFSYTDTTDDSSLLFVEKCKLIVDTVHCNVL